MTKRLSLTERRCSVCSHPGREAIEEEFVHRHSIGGIEYAVERRAVYRHVHAFGRNQISNRESHLLELLASRGKQTMEAWSNREFFAKRPARYQRPRPRFNRPSTRSLQLTHRDEQAMTQLIENKAWRSSLIVTSTHGASRRIRASEIPILSGKPEFVTPKRNTGLDTLCRASFPAFALPAILVFNLQPGCAIEPEAITGEEIE